MSELTTHVGIDAQKAELQVAMLVPEAAAPVAWTVRNEARTVERLRRKLERVAPGARCVLLRSRTVRLRVAAAARPGPRSLPGDRAGVGAAQAGRADQDGPPGRPEAGGAVPGGTLDGGAGADAGAVRRRGSPHELR